MTNPHHHTPSFVLASASPRRRQLLEEHGYRFFVRPSSVEEPPPSQFPTPEAYVAHTAWLKAADRAGPRKEWILAADTVAVAGGTILGKPAHRENAARILRLLAGTEHRVMTGVCLHIPSLSCSLVAVETTIVSMRPLTAGDLEAYLDTGLWEGKAGAYGIQDHDDPFVTAVDGSYSNVMGLPMERLATLFASALRMTAD